MKHPIRLLIADDHQLFLDGLTAMLSNDAELEVSGQALNGEDVLSFLSKHEVDVVLLDINMPVLSGIDTTRKIVSEYPEVKVLMLTMYNKKEFISSMLEAGVAGYVLKNTGKTELKTAIQTVMSGGHFYSKEVTETIMEGLRSPRAKQNQSFEGYDAFYPQLTKRELEVLQLITKELTTSEIAEKLFISQHTAETHRKNLLSKLGARNTAGLVKQALLNGLV